VIEDYISPIHYAAIEQLNSIRDENKELAKKLATLIDTSKKTLSNARHLPPEQLEALTSSIDKAEKLLLEVSKRHQS